MGLRVVVLPEADVPRALRAQVWALHVQAWPGSDPGAHDPALRPLSMLLVDDEGARVLAALAVLSKPLDHQGIGYAASGLSTVVTAEDSRRAGHGLRVVQAAIRRMEADGADLALFTCDPPLSAFYERAGFTQLPGTQLIGGTAEDPFPSGPLGKLTFASFFTSLAEAHRADFIGADVALYPGTTDRLW